MKYKESEKLNREASVYHTVMDFLEWLGQNDMLVMGMDECGQTEPVYVSLSQLTKQFMGVDEKQLEVERRHMLDVLSGRQS